MKKALAALVLVASGVASQVCWLVCLVACGAPSPGPPSAGPSSRSQILGAPGIPVEVAGEAAAGTTDPALRELLAQHWDWMLRRTPSWATHLGDHRFDDDLGDFTPRGFAEARAATRAFLDRARALPKDRLGDADRTTLALLVELLAADDGLNACAPETWRVSARDNALVWAVALPDDLVVRTLKDGEHLVARYRKLPHVIDGMGASLKIGAGQGKTAPAEVVRRTIALLDGELARPTHAWGLVTAAVHWHAGWTAGDEVAFAGAILRAVDEGVRPALLRYRDVLATTVLPLADRPESLSAMPGGAACYRALTRYQTTVDRSPDELHALGLVEIARIDAEMTALGHKVLGTTDLPSTLARLRSDPGLRFSSGADIETTARRALAAAEAAVPRWVGIRPRAACEVRPMPAYEAPYSTTGYYREANVDGSRPGTYMVNTYQPGTKVRYDAEALAFHESVPGHHLQIAIAQELGRLPALRRFWTWGAYTEGWALYAERLADEMHLYSSDLDRIGMLSFDAWRAARLVVDTGLHARGWTRAQAEAFLLEHTALAEANVRNEVDRYIGDPAQALAYKVGQLEIVALRRQAEAALGERFVLAWFHDVVLGGGGVTLDVLAARVRAWIASEGAGAMTTVGNPDRT